MKKTIFLFICLFYLASLLNAQITGATRYPLTKKTDPSKTQTLQLNQTNTYIPKPPTQPTQVIDMNAALPDIKLVSFKINYLGSQDANGEIIYNYEINYVLKNEGNISVAADSIGVQGYLSYQTPVPTTISACGALINRVPGLILTPGYTHRGYYRCSSKIDRNNNPVYMLYVDNNNTVKELNEQNNMAQLPITF